MVNVLAIPNLVQNTEANLWGYQQHLTSLSFGLLVAYPSARATIGPSPRPGMERQTFVILAVVVQVALAPLVLLLRQPIELLLQADAWLLGCAMWGCGAGRIMRERLAFGYALLALPLFAMLFDSHWSVPTAAAFRSSRPVAAASIAAAVGSGFFGGAGGPPCRTAGGYRSGSWHPQLTGAGCADRCQQPGSR